MKKIRASTIVGFILLLIFPFPNGLSIAKNGGMANIEASLPSFELNNGDRVVFLGNSLIENDLQFGYLEFVLTSRWPDRDITFRNLGWTGDTVFGEARSYFTNPPGPYELLVEQITKAQPTVVFVAYGANEALEGKAGINGFNKGLNQLLNKLDELGAKAILLSTIPQISAGSPEILSLRNENLELYSSEIAKVASERDLLYIDIFHPLLEIKNQVKITDDGVHLNERGYFHLASILKNVLGITPPKWSVTLDASKHSIDATVPAKIMDSDGDKKIFRFTVNDGFLPIPLPPYGGEIDQNYRILKIAGLKKGFYTLKVDGAHVISASAKKWAEGVEIKQGAPFTQANHLRDLILKKNELYFHHYRPQNRTYIIGFRSYEQGRHVKGLEELSIIIEWLEGQIRGSRVPKSNVYQLSPLK